MQLPPEAFIYGDSMEKAYNKIKKDFNLPDFDILNKEFEIGTMEPEGFLLREIKRKINEKLSSARDFLTALIQPETTSLVDLYECRCFDDEAKTRIFALFSKVMHLKRKINESELVLDDDVDAEIIKEAAKNWPKIREQMIPFVKELKVCWEKTPESDKISKEYLG